MDKQEVTTFTELYIKFQEQCKHVAKILSEYDCNFKEFRFNDWELDYDDRRTENKFNCYTEVYIIAYGCHVDIRSLSFPIELLSSTDDQIHQYAQNKYKK